MLASIRCVNGDDNTDDMCLDEFSRAGLMNSLNKSTKIFMTDETDITLVDTGLFNSFARPSAEMNCRCRSVFLLVCIHFSVTLALVMILYDRMNSPYVRRLANKTIVVEKSKLNLLVSVGSCYSYIVVLE